MVTPCLYGGFVYWGQLTGMDLEDSFCCLRDSFHQEGIGPVGHIHQSTVIVLPVIAPPGQVLVAPLEIGGADQCWVFIGPLCIIAICYATFFL